MCECVSLSFSLFLRAVAAAVARVLVVVVCCGCCGGGGRFPPQCPSGDNWSSTASSGKANDWRNRQRVVLDLFSNWKWVRSIGFFGGPLGPSDDPTWANFGKQH